MKVKALVLCAGFGTRLGELTRELPKPLLPLQGTPLLVHTLRHLAHHGIEHVAINLHHLGEMIRTAIGDGARFGLTIHYANEARLLGTAGSVRNLADWFADAEHALVVYGDLLFDEDLTAMLAFHERHAADATLLVHRNERSNSRLHVGADGRIVDFEERPAAPRLTEDFWVNSGVQLLRTELIARLPETVPADLPRDVYAPMCHELALYAYPLRGYRCAIDSPERYRMADDAVRDGLLAWQWPAG